MSDFPTPQRHALPIDGHTLYYETFDDGAAGEPIVFIHGVTANMATWYTFIPPFLGRGRVILLTLPGHYPATFPSGYDEAQITAAAWGDLAGAAIAQITDGQPATVIGHSTGGFLAVAAAWRAPEIARRVVSISGFAQGAWSGVLGLSQRGLLTVPALYYPSFWALYGLSKLSASILAAMMRIYNPGFRANGDPTATRRLARRAMDDYRRLEMANMARVFRAMRDHVDMRGDLGAITAPVLAITGADDPTVPPEQARLIAEGVPQGTLHTTPGGHTAYFEYADEMHDIIFHWLEETA